MQNANKNGQNGNTFCVPEWTKKNRVRLTFDYEKWILI